MNNCKSIIPTKALKGTLTDGEKLLIDTKGTNCLIKALSGKVNLFIRESDMDASCYVLSEGETLDLCGKLYLSGNQSEFCAMMFTTL